MKRLTAFITKKPGLVVALTLIISVVLGIFIKDVWFDNDVKHLVPEKNSDNVFSDEIESTFGTQSLIFVELFNDSEEGVFNFETLKRIERISHIFEGMDYVDEVDSVAVSDNIVGDDIGMNVGPVWEEGALEDDPELIARIRRDVFSNPLYLKSIISEDGKAAGILLKLKDTNNEVFDLETARDDFTADMNYFAGMFTDENIADDIKREDGSLTVKIAGNVSSEELTAFMCENSIYSNKFFNRTYIEEDHSFVEFSFDAKYLTMLTEDKVVEDIKKVLREIPGDEEEYYSGEKIVNSLLGHYMMQDVTRMVPMVVIVVLLCLLFAFRTIRGVLFPLLSVLFSTVWVMGLMGLLNVPLNQASVALPVLLIGVGSAYGIHVMNSYYEHIRDKGDRKAIISKIMEIVGIAVVMAGVTTVIGFMSLTTSPMIPMKNFGLFTALGILFALIMNVVFVPACLVLLPKPKKIREEYAQQEGDGHKGLNRFLSILGRGVYKARSFILVFSLIIMAFAVWGITKVITDTNTIEAFKSSSMVRIADDKINERFGGTSSLNIVIDGLTFDMMKEPEVLKKIERIQRYAESQDYVGKTVSFVDYVKLMNKAMNNNDPDFYTIPDSRELIAQYLFLYSSSGDPDDFKDVVDYNYQKANIMVQITKPSTRYIEGIVDAVEAFAQSEFAGGGEFAADPRTAALESLHTTGYMFDVESYQIDEVNRGLKALAANDAVASSEDMKMIVEDYASLLAEDIDGGEELASFPLIEPLNELDGIAYAELEEYAGSAALVRAGGNSKLYLVVNDMIIDTQIKSIIMAVVLVILVVALMFRSAGAGLMSVLPLVLTILVNFGVMGFTGTKLNLATAMIASVSIGIGVDYAIHFLNRFKIVFNETGDYGTAIEQTMLTSGRAIIFNMVSVALGFLVLCFSNFPPLQDAGWLIALTMIVSSVGALTVLPTFLTIIKPRFLKKG